MHEHVLHTPVRTVPATYIHVCKRDMHYMYACVCLCVCLLYLRVYLFITCINVMHVYIYIYILHWCMLQTNKHAGIYAWHTQTRIHICTHDIDTCYAYLYMYAFVTGYRLDISVHTSFSRMHHVQESTHILFISLISNIYPEIYFSYHSYPIYIQKYTFHITHIQYISRKVLIYLWVICRWYVGDIHSPISKYMYIHTHMQNMAIY